jgi:membrane associated rhomboid family serine protease
MLILPFRLSISFTRLPVVNWAIIAFTVIVYCVQWAAPGAGFDAFILRDWDVQGIVGSLFLHGGITHLLGNMLFLWVFGNAVCSTVGNAAYPVLYLLCGVASAAVHLTFSGAPAIGASGAINGIMGASLVMFPVSNLDCAYVFFLPFFGLMKAGKFTLKCFWLITIWFLFDVAGILLGSAGVAYWGHIGGFVAGILLATLFLQMHWAEVFDPTMLDVIAGRADHRMFDADTDLELRIDALTASNPGAPARLEEQERELRRHTEGIHDLWTRDRIDPPAEEEEASGLGGRTPAQPVLAPADPPVPRVEMAPASPKLRILRAVRTDDALTCYFVNEGDAVSDLSVSAQAGMSAEIHPDRMLKKGDAGWMKISRIGTSNRSDLTVAVAFNDGAGGRGTLPVVVPAPVA